MHVSLRRLLGCSVVAVGGWASACGKDSLLGPAPHFVVTPSQSTIAVGDTVRLRADVVGRPGPARVLWSTSTPAIVSVDSVGLVRGLAVGQGVVTAWDAQEPTGPGSARVDVRVP